MYLEDRVLINAAIVKSNSGVRLEGLDLTSQRLQHKRGSLDYPVHLQPKLQGINIRAHVCGETSSNILNKITLCIFIFLCSFLVRLSTNFCNLCKP